MISQSHLIESNKALCAPLDAMTLLNTHTWLWSREIGVHNFSENTWWDCSSFFFTGCVWHLDFLFHDWGETRKQNALILQNGLLQVGMKKRKTSMPYEPSWALFPFQHSNSFQLKKAIIKIKEKMPILESSQRVTKKDIQSYSMEFSSKKSRHYEKEVRILCTILQPISILVEYWQDNGYYL